MIWQAHETFAQAMADLGAKISDYWGGGEEVTDDLDFRTLSFRHDAGVLTAIIVYPRGQAITTGDCVAAAFGDTPPAGARLTGPYIDSRGF